MFVSLGWRIHLYSVGRKRCCVRPATYRGTVFDSSSTRYYWMMSSTHFATFFGSSKTQSCWVLRKNRIEYTTHTLPTVQIISSFASFWHTLVHLCGRRNLHWHWQWQWLWQLTPALAVSTNRTHIIHRMLVFVSSWSFYTLIWLICLLLTVTVSYSTCNTVVFVVCLMEDSKGKPIFLRSFVSVVVDITCKWTWQFSY